MSSPSTSTATVMARDALRWATRWPGAFIVIYLLLQMLLPLGYYLWRSDPHDERWAWRMFSPMRMVICSVEYTVDDQKVTLGKDFHVAWIETAQRGRRVVFEQMGRKLCRKHPGKEVTVRLECRPLAPRDSLGPPPPGVPRAAWYRGAPYSLGGRNLCDAGK